MEILNPNKEAKLDFLMIGARKCGTTWIYECLQDHPEIYLISTIKNRSSNKPLFELDEEEFNRAYTKYSPDEEGVKAIGELNETYMEADREVLDNIKSHNPDMRIIVSLRNPIERAFSGYLCVNSLQNKGWESFEDAIRKEPQLVERGFYFQRLKNYFEIFSEENILVLIFEKAKQDQEQFIKRIYEFLEVNSSYQSDRLFVETGSARFKRTKFAKFLHHYLIPPLKKIKVGWKLKKSSTIRRLFYQFGSAYSSLFNLKKPEISSKMRNKLTQKYEEDISKLESLIGKDLSAWKRNEK